MGVQPANTGRWVSTLLVGGLCTALTACGSSSSSSGGGGGGGGKAASGTLASSVDLKGVSITVGSKEFTEQLILGKIMVQTLKGAGATVKDQTHLTGTPVVRKGLETKRIDAYYEYTGTGWINILKNTKPVVGSAAQFQAVKTADAKNNVVWFAVAPANNTYAIAGNHDASAKDNVTTISEYAALAKKSPSSASLCTASEFITRDDGLPGLEKTYGFTLPSSAVKQLDFGLVHASVKKGDPCKYAVVFATDGQISANKEVVLKDDKGFFPSYNIAVSMRKDTYDAHKAQYDKLFQGLDKLLTTEQMQKLNAAVDVEGKPVDRVVSDFLKEKKVT